MSYWNNIIEGAGGMFKPSSNMENNINANNNDGFFGSITSGAKGLFKTVIDTADVAAGSNIANMYFEHQREQDKIDYAQAERERLNQATQLAHSQVVVKNDQVSVSDNQKTFDMETMTSYWPFAAGVVGILIVVMALKR